MTKLLILLFAITDFSRFLIIPPAAVAGASIPLIINRHRHTKALKEKWEDSPLNKYSLPPNGNDPCIRQLRTTFMQDDTASLLAVLSDSLPYLLDHPATKGLQEVDELYNYYDDLLDATITDDDDAARWRCKAWDTLRLWLKRQDQHDLMIRERVYAITDIEANLLRELGRHPEADKLELDLDLSTGEVYPLSDTEQQDWLDIFARYKRNISISPTPDYERSLARRQYLLDHDCDETTVDEQQYEETMEHIAEVAEEAMYLVKKSRSLRLIRLLRSKRVMLRWHTAHTIQTDFDTYNMMCSLMHKTGHPMEADSPEYKDQISFGVYWLHKLSHVTGSLHPQLRQLCILQKEYLERELDTDLPPKEKGKIMERIDSIEKFLANTDEEAR